MLFDWELWLVGNGAFFLTPNFQGMMDGWMDGRLMIIDVVFFLGFFG